MLLFKYSSTKFRPSSLVVGTFTCWVIFGLCTTSKLFLIWYFKCPTIVPLATLLLICYRELSACFFRTSQPSLTVTFLLCNFTMSEHVLTYSLFSFPQEDKSKMSLSERQDKGKKINLCLSLPSSTHTHWDQLGITTWKVQDLPDPGWLAPLHTYDIMTWRDPTCLPLLSLVDTTVCFSSWGFAGDVQVSSDTQDVFPSQCTRTKERQQEHIQPWSPKSSAYQCSAIRKISSN